MTLRSVSRVAALALVGLVLGLSAQAFIPKVERVVRAVAKRNDDAGRGQPLRLDLVLRIEGSDPIGSGTLVTHPTGLARLELRGAGGSAGEVVERHVLQGGEHLAMRNGERVSEPRAFLPPLFLLQAERELDLRSGLEQIGADLAAIGLAPCGESDCYVIGDPGRVPPPFERPGKDGLPAGNSLSGAPFEPVPPRRLADPLTVDGQRASIWVDLVTYEPRRIDLRSGVRVWFGPPATFERVQLPSWIRIDEPGKRPATFDVVAVSPVAAPAAAFSRSWLERPLPTAPAKTAPEPLSGENP
jgi:hypothetical protein